MIKVCVAGATGWVGQTLVPAIEAASDLELVGAISRSGAGQKLGRVVVRESVEEALAVPTDVLIDYTTPAAAKRNTLAAIDRRVHVVIGTSGLTDEDYAAIDAAARSRQVGVLAAGNFAISSVLLQHFALIAARYLPSWEILDYAKAEKTDAPSGTARELAYRLATVRAPAVGVPIADTQGAPEARGTTLNGTQIHSIRLPGYVIGVEVLFGKPDETLSLRFAAGSGAEPYVDGTLLAVRKVGGLVGLRRGLDQILDLA
jgi:4-hydroxy-tetrahydrodipicolinate reductase